MDITLTHSYLTDNEILSDCNIFCKACFETICIVKSAMQMNLNCMSAVLKSLKHVKNIH